MGRAGLFTLFLFLGCCCCSLGLSEKQATCGYDLCPAINTDPAVTNVHLVPHSHDDVGWLKTVDQYYYGSKNGIQRAGVQHIIDSVVQELSLDASKRFIQVETAFFWRWWHEQTEATQTLVHQLVEEGRLEFIGGGWSMNDEATTHYSSIIDNMALGLKTLKEIFGECGVPKVAWQIDPFGHSREQASLFAQMGFDGLFFARIDERDKTQRQVTRNLQMVWEGTDNLGESTSIFTGVFPNHYSAPEGFCFDIRCEADPIQDDHTLKDYNLEQKLTAFIGHVDVAKAFHRNTNNIMFTMGDDFTYQNAAMYYKNMDKLIKHMNARTADTNINVLYSTPSCFLKALNDKENEVWPTKTDDFFPYANGPHSYWAGYFTSRPSFKYHERQSNALLQAAKQVNAMSATDRQGELRELQNAMAVSQHHDAVTGTAKQAVDSDYNLRLGEGQQSSSRLMAQQLFLNMGVDVSDGGQLNCPLLNISSCGHTENSDNLVFLVYNSLPRSASFHVKLPVQSGSSIVFITDDKGDDVAYETIEISQTVKNIPGRASQADMELVFLAQDVPALGYKAYYYEKVQADAPSPNMITGRHISVEEFQADLPDDLNVALKYYMGQQDQGQSSGAYIFRPRDNVPTVTNIVGDIVKLEGDVLTEWRVTLDIDWASYIVRQYANEKEYEIEWLVGPIPVDDDVGKEVIMTYTSPTIDSDGLFWTDANGRQMMPRKKDDRYSYDLEGGQLLEPVASNYYPITTGIYLQSASTQNQMSILTDRSQGGTSVNEGEVELMVHRRLLRDDGYGVGEALNEEAFGTGLVAIGKHYYFYGTPQESVNWRRTRMHENYLQPTLLFYPTQASLEQFLSYPNKAFSGLTRDLPDNVNLLTLETWNESGDVLVRLEHTFEALDADPELSQPVLVDLEGLFATVTPGGITEMTLGGNRALAEASRLHWNTEKWNEGHEKTHEMQQQEKQGDFQIELQPMQIKTFLMTKTKAVDPDSGVAELRGSGVVVAVAMMLVHLYQQLK